jgi:hypothetical protein
MDLLLKEQSTTENNILLDETQSEVPEYYTLPHAPDYKNIQQEEIVSIKQSVCETNLAEANDFLEKETTHNKSCSWNKIDKTEKVHKLKLFAEKYGKDHKYNNIEVNNLKHFLITSLEKNKLQKAKDVIYDKDKKELVSIPSLYFNNSSKNFTLKITDTKRVSTLKSLTPKRNSVVSTTDEEI